ncbi:basic leucine zipper 19-like [Phragmites australis]|uniref:basic leucine zipper 19-like n=1 Tax=Phragmites australis TaxID=29695 RepID=UPI002D797562|nr:basic leucine zipper 19-like [Phragmites australis]
MAQLPPRAPSAGAAAGEFLGFAAARRGAHRRSASESAAFLEAVPMDDAIGGEFDRLDDEQLMSMFSDVDAPAVSDGAGGERAGDAHLMDMGDAEDGMAATSPAAAAQAAADGVADPKRVKRILANRQSAQRSRVRKLQYISELERSVTSLQMEVSALSPRVAFLDHQRSLLTVGNSHLKQRIAALAQDKIFKDAHQEALKKEIERLRQLYHHQQIKATTGGADIATVASMQARQELLACEGAAIR